jgi:hypothetical protein
MPISPTAEGFRAAFRRPSLTLAEITWRWTAGATATALFLFGLFEYLSTLPVTNGELLFLRTRHPYLVSEAIAHILRGSLSRAVGAAMLAVLMLTVLWIVAASVGRIATVRGLLEYFHRDAYGKVDGEKEIASASGGVSVGALLKLNFLRASLALAAMLGIVGATILAGFASPESNPQPGLALVLFLLLAGLTCLVWWELNWLLSLAGMFAVRNKQDAMEAITAAVIFCRERAGPVGAVSAWTGLAHLVAFVGATTVASMLLGFAGFVPWRLVCFGVIVVTLVYFVLADWLYTARLAGYVCIAETPQTLLKPSPPPPRPVPPPIAAPPIRTAIDRDELILSDVSDLAAET